ncbi:MAG: hypothetical protein JWQ99_2608 [Blastococcus sp.]|nr:hypothetical protein [Blastococcus sp.]
MTSFRRLRTIAVTVLMTAGLGVATAPTASAATTCEYFADLPARVSIDRPEVRVAVPVRGCEGYMDYASADVYGPAGFHDILIWDGTRTDYWYLYDWDTPPGVYDTNDGHGYTQDMTQQPWRADTTVVKFATQAGVSATRSGGRVTINALATRYDGGSNKFIPFANRVVAIDQCLTPTSSCSVLAYAVTNAAGRASVTVNAPALRSYQVRYGESSSFWGSTSTRVRA